MRRPFQLEIMTRERSVLRAEVMELVAPGADGYLGIWAGHAPLLTWLQVGVMTFEFPDAVRERVAVTGGFLEVTPEKTVVLAEAAERAEEIDRQRAEEARRRAEERLTEAELGYIDSDRARRALARALNRLHALEE